MDQCKQLLSLSLVHPAFNQDDRAKLSYWLARLHEKPEHRPNVQSPTLEKPPFPLPGQGRETVHRLVVVDQATKSV